MGELIAPLHPMILDVTISLHFCKNTQKGRFVPRYFSLERIVWERFNFLPEFFAQRTTVSSLFKIGLCTYYITAYIL